LCLNHGFFQGAEILPDSSAIHVKSHTLVIILAGARLVDGHDGVAILDPHEGFALFRPPNFVMHDTVKGVNRGVASVK
jgi:hypothetical protein